MKLYQIVFHDVRRRKKRVLFTALGVVIGAMMVIGITTISNAGEQQIYNQLEKYGPNLTVIPAINNMDLKLGNVNLGTLSLGDNYIPESRIHEIRKIADHEIKMALDIEGDANIAIVGPKLFLNTTVNEMSVVVVGIDPIEERLIKTWWHVSEGEYFSGGKQAMAGVIAAQLLNLRAGETLTLNGTGVTVTGVLGESGSDDDYMVFLPLDTLQEIFNKDGFISSIDIRALCTGCPVEQIADAINNNIPGVRAIAVKQVANAEMDMMENITRFMLALAGITVCIGLFAVVNTMMTSVNERVKDIGIMRAIGASRNQIFRIFIYEGIIIGIIGGGLGYFAGTALAYLTGPLIFRDLDVSFVPVYLLYSLLFSCLIAVAASLYPAYRAIKIKVADSFRAI